MHRSASTFGQQDWYLLGLFESTYFTGGHIPLILLESRPALPVEFSA